MGSQTSVLRRRCYVKICDVSILSLRYCIVAELLGYSSSNPTERSLKVSNQQSTSSLRDIMRSSNFVGNKLIYSWFMLGVAPSVETRDRLEPSHLIWEKIALIWGVCLDLSTSLAWITRGDYNSENIYFRDPRHLLAHPLLYYAHSHKI